MAHSNDSDTVGEEQPAMNDPQSNSAVQSETDNDDNTNEVKQPSYDDCPIRMNDPDIENVVGLGYD